MKYIPKEIKGNVNVSSVSAVKDFFELLAKILGAILFIYIVLGFAVDYIAPRISFDTELKLGGLFSRRFEKKERTKKEDYIQGILNRLVKHDDSLPKFDYKVYLEDSKEVNAVALPAGHIVIFSALLKETDSDNELAMVLSHELGHFVHKDHLRGLGRGLVFLVVSSALFGADSSISKFIINFISDVEMRFSQSQERKADIYALELLNRTYGNVAGALDFYEKMAKKEKIGKFFYLFASHPYPQDRINALKEEIKIKNYRDGEKIFFDKSFKK